MSPIRKIIEERDRSREAEAAVLAVAALDALWLAGCPAWLFGSLARGAFLGHSDIDILIDATGVAKVRAISVRPLPTSPPMPRISPDRTARSMASNSVPSCGLRRN